MGLGGDSTLMAGMVRHQQHPPLPTKSFFTPLSPRRPAQQRTRQQAPFQPELAEQGAGAPQEGGGAVGQWLEALPSDVSALAEEGLYRDDSWLPAERQDGEEPTAAQQPSPFDADAAAQHGEQQREGSPGVESEADWAAAAAAASGSGRLGAGRPPLGRAPRQHEVAGSPEGRVSVGSPGLGSPDGSGGSWRRMQGGRGWAPPVRPGDEGGGVGDDGESSSIGSGSSGTGGVKHSLPISFRHACLGPAALPGLVDPLLGVQVAGQPVPSMPTCMQLGRLN